METIEITARTKQAIRAWAGFGPTDQVLLDDKLDRMRPASALGLLRGRLNNEFASEHGFPIPMNDWNDVQGNIKTVRNVRDFVKKRLES